MINTDTHDLLWWVLPGQLAGMPLPYIDTVRRLNCGGPLAAYADDLPKLHAAGIRAVVALLNLPSDAAVYESAGSAFLCLPIPDGGAPTLEQATTFVTFVTQQFAAGHPTAIHCEAGLGRTGTMLATWLIAQGAPAEVAILRVRAAEPSAIETGRQVRFLQHYATTVPPAGA